MEQKKILFIIKGGEEWVGGLHYIKSLIKTVKWYAQTEKVNVGSSLLVYEESQKRLFSDIQQDIDEVFVYSKDLPATNLLNRVQWWYKRKFKSIFNGRLDTFIRERKFDFVYPALPKTNFKGYRFAEWIPDFQFKHYPEGSNEQEINARKAQFKFICGNAPLIYLSSDHARIDCERLFPESRGKLSVMKFCAFNDDLVFAESIKSVLNEYNIPSKYLIVSNLLAPTKNLFVVIKAVAILKRKGIRVPVVVTGDLHDYRNPGFKHLVFQLINKENVREEMIMLGLIDRIKQKQLLANSIAIIQPSRFEGWNTLVEEAKWLNHPIILSDIPVHKEQAPATGIFFKDDDANDLADKMEACFFKRVDIPERKSISADPAYLLQLHAFATHFINVSLPSASAVVPGRAL